MPLIKKNETPLWGVWKIEESSNELLSMLDNKNWYSTFLQQHTMDGRKKEWLAVRVLLKTLLNKEERIGYLEHGTPYLPDHSSLHISISHTKGYAAVIVSTDSSPGIDIEYLSDRVKKISSRFMNNLELAQIDNTQETIHLLLHWSGKETLFKAMQKEEVEFSKHLHIHPFLPEKTGTFQAHQTRSVKKTMYTIHYEITDGFVVTYIC